MPPWETILLTRAQCLCALFHAPFSYFQSCLDQHLSPPLSNANASFICNTVSFSWNSLHSSIGSPDLLDEFLNSCILKFCLLFVCLTHIQLFVTLWTVAHQASLSMGFSEQEYWTGLPCPSPEDLPNPGIELTSCSLWQILYRFVFIPNLCDACEH